MITKAHFPFSWVHDRWSTAEHVCSKYRHTVSCEAFYAPLLKGRQYPFKKKSNQLAASPSQQLSLGFSVSYGYGVVIWD